MKEIKKGIFLQTFLIVIYVLSLTLVFCIPNQKVTGTVELSKEVFEREGDWPSLFFGEESVCRLDNFTDKIMLNGMITEEKSPFCAAMMEGEFTRYWQGYQVFLRPLSLILGNYQLIRYVNMVVFFFLLSYFICLVREKLGKWMVTAFMAALICTYSFLIPMSLQFSGVYYIFMISSIVILRYYSKERFVENWGLLFLTIGSVTNFIDFLTAPLLTLGLPLIILCVLKIEEKVQIEKSLWYIMFKASISWGIGYGITWISKWLLSTVVLKQNIIEEAVTAALFRMNGNGGFPVNRIEILEKNIRAIMPLESLKIGIIIVAVMMILCLAYCLKKRSGILRRWCKGLPFLFIAAFPYVWYAVLANHSQIHYWYTFRVQMITIVALFCLY